MVRVLIFVFLAHLALLIAALADCLGGERMPRRLSRPMWVLIIVLLPIAGAVLWFLAGRGGRPRGAAGGRPPPRGGAGPPARPPPAGGPRAARAPAPPPPPPARNG
jgi:hypothetical protein